MGRAGLEGPRQLSGDVRQDQSQEHRGHFRRDCARGLEEVTRRTKRAGCSPRSPLRGDRRSPAESSCHCPGPLVSHRFSTTPEGPPGRAGTRPSPVPSEAALIRRLYRGHSPPPGPGSADEGGRLGRPPRWGHTSRGRPLAENRLCLRSQRLKVGVGRDPPRPYAPLAIQTRLHREQHLPPVCSSAVPGCPPARGSLCRTPPPSVAGGKG